MIGIQNNRARGVWERRYALPASMISSKTGSFLNLPASRFHQGCWDTFRTAFNSDLIFRSSRSRTLTRCSNFVAVDCMALSLYGQGYMKCEREGSSSQLRVSCRRHHQRSNSYLHTKRWEKDLEGDRSSDRNRIGRESSEFSA
jgi:hypothetical protein